MPQAPPPSPPSANLQAREVSARVTRSRVGLWRSKPRIGFLMSRKWLPWMVLVTSIGHLWGPLRASFPSKVGTIVDRGKQLGSFERRNKENDRDPSMRVFLHRERSAEPPRLESSDRKLSVN
ncbi:hypothetical protein HZH66_009614 [Vespula vulgaris]|uniref:Uncharacterized protein n=1 Tax=Vespula vulgaris TaxID=7454 RepID=A0A834JMW4_VESVU|nr:hypothetical protein HZH66_009614 [Vespula vulgaris]